MKEFRAVGLSFFLGLLTPNSYLDNNQTELSQIDQILTLPFVKTTIFSSVQTDMAVKASVWPIFLRGFSNLGLLCL